MTSTPQHYTRNSNARLAEIAENDRLMDEATFLIRAGYHARDLFICLHRDGSQHVRADKDDRCPLIVAVTHSPP